MAWGTEGSATGGPGPQRAPGPPAPPTPPSTWYVLAAIGALLFIAGVWTPAWKGVMDGTVLSLVFAIGGGALFVVGATYGYRAQQSSARTGGIRGLPGVEIYSPPRRSAVVGDEAVDPADETGTYGGPGGEAE